MTHIATVTTLAAAAGTLGAFFPPAGLALGLLALGAGFMARGNR
jgi:hypothetical protein